MNAGKSFSHWCLLMLPLTWVSASAAIPRQRASIPTRPFSAQAYRTDWSNVGSCDEFKEKLWQGKVADKLVQQVAISGLAAKSEFETQEQHRDRLSRDLPALIDPDRVYLIHSIDPALASYDAGRQVLSVSFPVYAQGGNIPLAFSLKKTTKPGTTYLAQNAFGASMRVRKEQTQSFAVEYAFPQGTLHRPITFPMIGGDARLFKEGLGKLHILGRITSSVVRRGVGRPTTDRPIETTYESYEVQIEPRCAFVTFGNAAIDEWHFDDW